MREFFRSWKRKTGLLTLMMACFFVAAWVRSGTDSDVILWRRFETRAFLASSTKGFSLGIRQQEISLEFKSAEYSSRTSWKWFGPFLWLTSSGANPVFDFKPLIVPYWPVVLLLTASSACLLLSPQRTTKPP